MKLRQSSLKSFFSESKSATTNLTSSTATAIGVSSCTTFTTTDTDVPAASATVPATSKAVSSTFTTTGTDLPAASATVPATSKAVSSTFATTAASDYELLREENIRRNQELLKKLGLASPINLLPTKPSISKPKPRPKSSAPISPPSVPLRRSARKRPQPQPQSSEETDSPGEPVKELQFEHSCVYNYACKRICLRESVGGVSSSGKFVGFEMVGRPLADPLLTRIYTVDVCAAGAGEPRALVAAGGHGGFISIFGTSMESCSHVDEEEDGEKVEAIEPLMSWKSSRSWVSGVRFAGSNAMLVVSTSNDGGILVWDVSNQPISNCASWSPPVVGHVRDLHVGGIYSMDLLKDVIVTASKDSSVGFCRMDGGGGVSVDRSVSGHHSGVIRGVSFRYHQLSFMVLHIVFPFVHWESYFYLPCHSSFLRSCRDADILADCGADGRICVLDTRLPEACAVTINSDHSTGINTIEWSPSNEFTLLSASKDPELLLYDVRNPREPHQTLHGHVGSTVRSCNNIYRPTFVGNDGAYIATSGQGSKKISIYEVGTGKIVSQGFIGYDANLVFYPSTVGGPPRLWAAARQIDQLSPIW
ncbi:transport protein [Nymphaea thermarum]|nr:transport protein [Nymphaea thermarum]